MSWRARIFKDSAIVIALLLALSDVRAVVGPYDEVRYCGSPRRDAAGNIIRNSSVPRVFQRMHACPSTGSPIGACPGYAADHVIPLACGGCDSVSNMQWLDVITKKRKDAYERRIYSASPPYPETGACVFRITPAQ